MFVLETVRGYKINLEFEVFQTNDPPPVTPNRDLDSAIEKLLLSDAIEKFELSEGQFLSSFFLTPKSDGTLRFILNLKKFNEFVKKSRLK